MGPLLPIIDLPNLGMWEQEVLVTCFTHWQGHATAKIPGVTRAEQQSLHCYSGLRAKNTHSGPPSLAAARVTL